MSTVTRAQLITRVAERANTSGYADPSTGGEISRLVDTSLGKLHNLFVSLYEDYAIARQVIALKQEQQFYALPADFMKMRAMFYLTPSPSAPNDWTQAQQLPLRRMDTSEVTNYSTTGAYPNYPFGYVLENRNVRVVPTPGSGVNNQLLVEYVPEYTPAVNDSTPIEQSFAFGWDEWVVNDVCVQIRLKSMMPVAELVQERALYEQEVRKQAKHRNSLEAPRIRDTGWKYGNGTAPWGNFSFTR